MQPKMTQRGFLMFEFKDHYDADCTIQESSLVVDEEKGACIWFGTYRDRMHLSQEQVKELLPILQHFAEYGFLPYEPNDAIQQTKTDLPDAPRPDPDPKALEKAARSTAKLIRSYTENSTFALHSRNLWEMFQQFATKLEVALGDVPEERP